MDAKSASEGRLKPEKIAQLQHIIEHDYGVVLSPAEAERFGFSLLKITRQALRAYNRAEERHAASST